MKNKYKFKVTRLSSGHYVAFKRRGNYWIYATGTTVAREVKTLRETIETMNRLNAICNPGRTFKTIITAKMEG